MKYRTLEEINKLEVRCFYRLIDNGTPYREAHEKSTEYTNE